MAAFCFSYPDLEALPDKEGIRYEIIDGDLYGTKHPGNWHQMVCGNVLMALHGGDLSGEAGMALLALQIIFSRDDVVIPDALWARKERFTEIRGSDGYLHGAPDIVIEVLVEGTATRDRELKLALYNRHQVPEYWIVDWEQRQVEVYRREEEGLALTATLGEGDSLTSPQLPGFTCPASSLFTGLPA